MGTKKSYLLYSLLLAALLSSLSQAQPGTWSEPVNISNNVGDSCSPDMAIGPDGKIHVVWADDSRLDENWMDDILYSVFDGIEWSEPLQISSFDTTASANPKIALDLNDDPHVVWTHRAYFSDPDVYYTALTDSGWLEPENLTRHYSTARSPDIVIDSENTIHVVWSDYIFGNGEILYMYNNGGGWSDYVNVSNDPITSGAPVLVIDNLERLHVAWQEYAEMGIQCEVFYSCFNGVSWSQGLNISQNYTFPSTHPDIAIDVNNNPHIVWNQVTQWGTAGVIEEIYYSLYNGIEWSIPENITNLSLRLADYPQLAIDSNNDKHMLLGLKSQFGDSYVNYTFSNGTGWTYPDSVFDEYSCFSSCLAIDSDNNLKACVPISFIPNNREINYTYLISNAVSDDNLFKVPITKEIALENYPNPFNNSTTIFFNLSRETDGNITVINSYGQIINNLHEGALSGGLNYFNWNGTNDYGKEVSAGVYFVRLRVNEQSIVRKVLLIK